MGKWKRDDQAAIEWERAINERLFDHINGRNPSPDRKSRHPSKDIPCIIRKIENAVPDVDSVYGLIDHLTYNDNLIAVAPRISNGGRLVGFWWVFDGFPYSDLEMPEYSIRSLKSRGLAYDEAQDLEDVVALCAVLPDCEWIPPRPTRITGINRKGLVCRPRG
jgi:hypothetical protein